MKLRLDSALFWEMAIFAFPLTSEAAAFCSAVFVKQANFALGSELLLLLAGIKLASSILEYKGYEEAYLAYKPADHSLFQSIGVLQLTQAVVLPLVLVGAARQVLGWELPAPLLPLLLWVGAITSLRQFLSYRWRLAFRFSAGRQWPAVLEVVLAYAWVAALAVMALRHGQATGVALAAWGLLAAAMVAVAGGFALRRRAMLRASISARRWFDSIGQASASQLSKEFFIIVATANVTAGFIARAAVTAFGLGIVFPVGFFRIRIFDRFAGTEGAPAGASPAMDHALRRSSLLASGGLIALVPVAWYCAPLTGINFPFAATLVALALAYPVAAFDAMSYFTLLRQGRRRMCTVALVAGGALSLLLGAFAARGGFTASVLAFSFILILGLGDFMINKISKALAHR